MTSLIIGGTDTTRVAMASQVALLLQHREQWDAVRADPSLVRDAVAEALGFEPSVGSLGRVTLEAVPLGDAVIPAGRFVSLSILSAIRDEAFHEWSDLFDIRRAVPGRPHAVFNGGAHRCPGEALAWAELEEGLSALLSRFPGLRLAGPAPTVRGHMGIRRIDAMPVAW